MKNINKEAELLERIINSKILSDKEKQYFIEMNKFIFMAEEMKRNNYKSDIDTSIKFAEQVDKLLHMIPCE